MSRPDPVAVAAARVAATAAGCANWPELAGQASKCTACPELVASRQHVVVGEAPPDARLLLIGEAPGAAEDDAGRPFVGRSGRLLDELLGETGLDRAEVAVVNLLKCRPPGNRTPLRSEVRRCRGWLDRQVELVAPLVTCTLGLTAATWVLGAGVRLSAVRGRLHDVPGPPPQRVVATYHPSAAIRFGPAGAPLAALRADLRLVATVLADLATGPGR